MLFTSPFSVALSFERDFLARLRFTRVHRDMHTTGICTVRVRAVQLFRSAGTLSSLPPTYFIYIMCSTTYSNA